MRPDFLKGYDNVRYFALASDYDGTLAQQGRVRAETVVALEKLLATGRKLLLVTGRELDELLSVFPKIDLFDCVVAENGALLYYPASKETKVLGEAPPRAFLDSLRKRNVTPVSVGRVIVATWQPHENAVLESIRDLGLDLQVIFNKDAVMILPASVNKATGLAAALKVMELSAHEVIGVGDAENDLAFLSMCECAVAVSNALITVKERADLVTTGDHGGGVEELIARLLADDLGDVQASLGRHSLVLGKSDSGEDVRLASYGCSVLIAGPSSSGKSTLAKSILESLEDHQYQFCIVDPEGDYDALEGAVTVGSSKHGPTVDEILQVLKKPGANAVVNLVGLPLADRPPFFLTLLPRLQEMRGRTGRPHWIVVDETHHLMPSAWEPSAIAWPQDLDRVIFLTVHPEEVATIALRGVSTIIAVGPHPEQTIERFCTAVNENPPRLDSVGAESGRVVLWQRREGKAAISLRIKLPRQEHHRHIRKYAEGELPKERSFYFRGPEAKLNLRAQNLMFFLQIADGVDDETWLYHLREGDYSRWFRAGIKDEVLAAQVEPIEKQSDPSAKETRDQIKKIVEKLYTSPASALAPMPGPAATPKKTIT